MGPRTKKNVQDAPHPETSLPKNLRIIHTIDRAIFKYMLKPPAYIRRRSVPEGLGHDDRLEVLSAFAKAYPFHADDLEQNLRFYSYGTDPERMTRRYEDTPDGRYSWTDFQWPSDYSPHWQGHHLTDRLAQLGVDRSKSFRHKFFECINNQTSYARLYRRKRIESASSKPRPIMICIHGYFGGNFSVEERVWPIETMLDLGYDVAMLVLPFHGPRKEKNRQFMPPRFPSADPRFTSEAIRQTVHDYCSLRRVLELGGYQSFSVAGMSLGGYCASLISLIDPRQELVVPVIPLVNFAELPFRQNRLGQSELESLEQKNALKRFHQIVDPLSYEPRIASSKVHIVAGRADAITGISHAAQLALHFKTEVISFDGSHLFRFGVAEIWRKILRQG